MVSYFLEYNFRYPCTFPGEATRYMLTEYEHNAWGRPTKAIKCEGG